MLSPLQLRFIGEVMLRSYLDRKALASVDVKGTDTQANILSYGEFIEALMQLQSVDGRAVVRNCVELSEDREQSEKGLETTVVNMKTWVDEKCETCAGPCVRTLSWCARPAAAAACACVHVCECASACVYVHACARACVCLCLSVSVCVCLFLCCAELPLKSRPSVCL